MGCTLKTKISWELPKEYPNDIIVGKKSNDTKISITRDARIQKGMFNILII